MNYLKSFLLCTPFLLPSAALAGDKLTGQPIGTVDGYSYETGQVVKNIQGNAFDGNLNTYFATNDRSYTWVGLDLGSKHIIDKVGWAPRNTEYYGPKRVQLGVIQGANSEDFLDAVPLYIITEQGTIGKMSYGDVNVSKGFRYVRFVSTGDSRCNIAELEFYGKPGAGTDSHYFQISNIPTVIVNTVDAEEPYDKEHDIKSNIIIIDNNSVNISKEGTIRERGNGSRAFPKKPWRLKFDKKQNVLDAPAKAKKWTLINNYGDKTLMRNLVAFEIARRVGMKWVPWSRPVDVILNGEYKGCYQLCDQVEVNPGRLDITEMEPEDISGDALTGGYFLEVDAYAYQEPAGSWFETPFKQIPVTVKSPDDGGTPEQLRYITNYFNNLVTNLFGSNFTSPGYDYRSMFDVKSFVQHFVVNELVGNTDTYWSTYMYKERLDPVIYTGPVWDFDLGFDNDSRTYPIHARANDFLYRYSGSSAANNMNNFADRVLIDDTRTKDDIQYIWSVARNSNGITSESLNKYIDEMAETIDASQKLNFVRWPILNDKVHMNPRALGSFEKEVEAVKQYIAQRIQDLDKLCNYDPSIAGIDNVASDHEISFTVVENKIVNNSQNKFAVYTITGSKVYEGLESTDRLPSGIYIITSPAGNYKIAIK